MAFRIVGEHIIDHLSGKLNKDKYEDQNRHRVLRTGGSQLETPPSSSESGPAEGIKLRRFEMFSSRFCLLISTCCSSRRRRRSSPLKLLPLVLKTEDALMKDEEQRKRKIKHTLLTMLHVSALHAGVKGCSVGGRVNRGEG